MATLPGLEWSEIPATVLKGCPASRREGAQLLSLGVEFPTTTSITYKWLLFGGVCLKHFNDVLILQRDITLTEKNEILSEKWHWSTPEVTGCIPPPMTSCASWVYERTVRVIEEYASVFPESSVHRKYVFIHGGCLSNLEASIKTYCFDVQSFVWREVICFDGAPSAREAHCAVADSASHQAVLFGGRNAYRQFFNDTWICDMSNANFDEAYLFDSAPHASMGVRDRHRVIFSHPWEIRGCLWTCIDDKNKSISSCVPQSRYSFGACRELQQANNGRLMWYIHGGLSDKKKALNDLWRFDLFDRTWSPVGPKNHFNSPYRHSHQLLLQTQQSVYVHQQQTANQQTNKFTKAVFVPGVSRLPTYERDSDLSNGGSQLFILGGFDDKYSLASFESSFAFDIDSSVFHASCFSGLQIPMERSNFAMSSMVGGFAIMFGGKEESHSLRTGMSTFSRDDLEKVHLKDAQLNTRFTHNDKLSGIDVTSVIALHVKGASIVSLLDGKGNGSRSQSLAQSTAVGVTLDVTERIGVEQALRDREALLHVTRKKNLQLEYDMAELNLKLQEEKRKVKEMEQQREKDAAVTGQVLTLLKDLVVSADVVTSQQTELIYYLKKAVGESQNLLLNIQKVQAYPDFIQNSLTDKEKAKVMSAKQNYQSSMEALQKHIADEHSNLYHSPNSSKSQRPQSASPTTMVRKMKKLNSNEHTSAKDETDVSHTLDGDAKVLIQGLTAQYKQKIEKEQKLLEKKEQLKQKRKANSFFMSPVCDATYLKIEEYKESLKQLLNTPENKALNDNLFIHSHVHEALHTVAL